MNKIRITIVALLILNSTNATARDFIYSVSSAKTNYTQKAVVSDVADSRNTSIACTDTETGEVHSIILDENNYTLCWHMTKGKGYTLDVEKRDKQLIVQSTKGSKSVSVIRQVDNNPFFASFDFGVSGFYQSGKETMNFWTLNPDNLKAYKMTLTRMEKETITYGNTTGEAQKIRISAAGVPASFFSMFFWVRTTDGVCVRSEGQMGGPGSKKFIKELLDIQQ